MTPAASSVRTSVRPTARTSVRPTARTSVRTTVRAFRTAVIASAAALILLAGCGPAGPAARRTATNGAGPTSPAQSDGGLSPSPTSPGPEQSTPAPPTHHTFPVVAKPVSYGRTHHDYPATDIFAACGSPVRAVTSGVILEVSRVDRFDPAHPLGADKGGLSVSLLGDDGVRYYGSHLSAIQPGISAGVRVAEGDRLGSVGRTGNASNVCHLHFGISPPCVRTGDWWTRRGVVWPWPYLDAWRAGQAKSPLAEATAWQQAHGCPTTVPPGTV